MLVVHRGERADRLLVALARVLAEPLADPFDTEVIAVHSRGMERWLAQRLSTVLGSSVGDDDGVCANVEFPFPGRLITRATAAGAGLDPDHDPWTLERQVWPLLEVVDEHLDKPWLGPLRTHLGRDDDTERAGRRFGAVRHIAELFDRYTVHRPEMIRRWADRDDVDAALQPLAAEHRWQARLWRELRDRVGVPSPAERHADAIAELRGDAATIDLPARLSVFGLTALPASYVAVLDAVAAHRDVHLFLLHPSHTLWRRVHAQVHDHRGAQVRGARLWMRDEDPTRELPANPLLTSWARDAREMQLVVAADGGRPEPDEIELPQDPPGSLLQRLQADVRNDRPPGRAPVEGEFDLRHRLDPHDRSLQIHACHGRARQVEVLRDVVLHLLAADPTLEVRDIVVMSPDIEAFAPLVQAVFGAEVIDGDGVPDLRVRLADRSIRQTNPVLDVVSTLVELPDSRITASAVLDLLSRGPVRRRAHFDDDDLDRIEGWITDLRIRWGLDGDHRAAHGLGETAANTWRAGLDRLLLGVAVGETDLALVGGAVPLHGVEGGDADLAGRLAEMVARLARALARLTGPQPIARWCAAISEAADALTAVRHGERWQRVQLARMLDDVLDEATVDGVPSPVPLTLAEIRALLTGRLGGRPTRANHRTGDLTFSTLVPMRSVPHRVICLLGLDDEAFPRRTISDADDLLDHAPRIGDRDPRTEDRQLLLDALLAATDTLVITHTGRDERTNEHRPPAVPVGELVDVIDRTAHTHDGRRTSDVITTEHPLQPFDPRSFTPGGLVPATTWSFDAGGLAAARALTAPREPPPPFLDGPLPPTGEDVIDLDALVAFLQHPVKAFVRRRLQVTLPGEGDRPGDAIPVDLDPLAAWGVGERLLGAWARGVPREVALRIEHAVGALPPGRLADSDVAAILDQLDKLIGLARDLGIGGAAGTLDVDVTLPDGRRVVGGIPSLSGDTVAATSYSRLKGKHRLAAWGRLVAASAAHPDRALRAVTVGRSKPKALAAVIEPLAGAAGARRDRALAHLAVLVDLYDRGLREPLPLYCETSLACADAIRADRSIRAPGERAWKTNGMFANEDRDDYHVLVLGSNVAFDTLLAELCGDDERAWSGERRRLPAYARRLWDPILEAERMVTR